MNLNGFGVTHVRSSGLRPDVGSYLEPVRIIVIAAGNPANPRSHLQCPGYCATTICAEFIAQPPTAFCRLEFKRFHFSLQYFHLVFRKINTDTISPAGSLFAGSTMASDHSCRGISSSKPHRTTLAATFMKMLCHNFPQIKCNGSYQCSWHNTVYKIHIYSTCQNMILPLTYSG